MPKIGRVMPMARLASCTASIGQHITTLSSVDGSRFFGATSDGGSNGLGSVFSIRVAVLAIT